ncbi:rod shape-determining protein MreC [Ligilactobacillus aviarius]|uniref:Cell shape-determining protein MreC n=1 Tax=Ligilactobacillus aviarius TaxID=1606 RepID=A0A179C3F0_9LACO|nr:rod shape-determining protein MreC [Ligilactobacillus aviarius]HJD08259.1 rod shape-determining protein MreC [Candidatus Ligilactobacillus faecavium]KRM38625.1 cell shape determining protein [Ligilactobacillus aviarius subsp. aviarius DSM 20655]OAP98204.1 rod shape-determining protein MreC [Ligilactobacillus aviarius]OAP99054.1 rod shape-determining protein MreC [Ligilactobacillus aviarius]OAP99235.1 rod shape-determining protein MreC [Ligilactobacillus aviarius]
MQKPFFNKKLVITMVSLIIAFLLIAFSIFVRNDRSTPSFIQNIGNSAAGVVDKVVNAPVEGISRMTGSVSNLTDTYQENAQLKKKLDSMNALQVENETLKQENKQLKQQLSLNKSLTSYTDISAYVISRSPSTWQNQIVISKGSNAGITKGSAVVSDKGLIGRVMEVNKNNSKVELVTTQDDAADRFAVQLIDNNGQTVNGLITGYDTDTNLLVMGQITSKENVKKGTQVITSGLGGTTPKGLFVGTVEKVVNQQAGLPTKIYIKPAADMTNLNVVTVAKRQD